MRLWQKSRFRSVPDSPRTQSLGAPVQITKCGGKYHPEHGLTLINEGDIDRKLAIARQKVFGTVQRIDQPITFGIQMEVFALLRDDGYPAVCEVADNDLMRRLIRQCQWRSVLFERY